MNHNEHFSKDSQNLRFSLITVSTTRAIEEDDSGEVMSTFLSDLNITPNRLVIKDDEAEILLALLNNLEKVDCFIFIGGTGLSLFDLTTRTIRKIAEREVPGFGELFRSRSEKSMAYLSDAAMFSYRGKIIFCLPGSPNAQETGYSIIKEIVFHAFHEANKQ